MWLAHARRTAVTLVTGSVVLTRGFVGHPCLYGGHRGGDSGRRHPRRQRILRAPPGDRRVAEPVGYENIGQTDGIANYDQGDADGHHSHAYGHRLDHHGHADTDTDAHDGDAHVDTDADTDADTDRSSHHRGG